MLTDSDQKLRFVQSRQHPQFELTHGWGTGATVAADGTHFHTYRDNLLAEFHIRYGKTGGIAYRHVADNYIALFSHFIGCGVYEATYILDALQKNTSDVRPTEIHADSHGQSEAAIGLAYLLRIELMPRIRRWAKLRLYRPSSADTYLRIDGLFRAATSKTSEWIESEASSRRCPSWRVRRPAGAGV